MTKRTLETSVDINADAATVWQVLMDFPAYAEWNPFIRSIEGQARPGERLSVVIQTPGQGGMRFHPRVQRAEQRRVFSWLGNLLMPGLFDGRHEFALEEIGEGTRFFQRETFSGLLAPLVWKKMELPTRAGFEAMNQAIKARAEALMKD
jgi:hypothetical protein